MAKTTIIEGPTEEQEATVAVHEQDAEAPQEASQDEAAETVAEAPETAAEAAEPQNDDTNDELRREIQILRDHDDAVRELADEVAELEEEYESAKLTANQRKKRLDEGYQRLRELAQSRPTFGPLFEGAKATRTSITTSLTPEAKLADDGTTGANAYKSVPIGALAAHGVSQKQIDKLLDAKITTLGKLGEISAREGGLSWFQDVPGIGESAAEKIQNAFADWCIKNRDKCEDRPQQEQGDEPAAALLSWSVTDDDELEAESQTIHDDGKPLVYRIVPPIADRKTFALSGDEAAVPEDSYHDTLEEAKAAAEVLEREHRSKVGTLLEWNKEDEGSYSATSAIGPSDDDGYEYFVSKQQQSPESPLMWLLDGADEIVPSPSWWETEAEAKAHAEELEREHRAKAADTSPAEAEAA